MVRLLGTPSLPRFCLRQCEEWKMTFEIQANVILDYKKLPLNLATLKRLDLLPKVVLGTALDQRG